MRYELMILAAVGALLFAPGVAAEDGAEDDECMLFEAWVYEPGSEMLFEAWVYASWVENDCAGVGDHVPSPLAGLLP